MYAVTMHWRQCCHTLRSADNIKNGIGGSDSWGVQMAGLHGFSAERLEKRNNCGLHRFEHRRSFHSQCEDLTHCYSIEIKRCFATGCLTELTMNSDCCVTLSLGCSLKAQALSTNGWLRQNKLLCGLLIQSHKGAVG
jgi:hypothetical protein